MLVSLWFLLGFCEKYRFRFVFYWLSAKKIGFALVFIGFLRKSLELLSKTNIFGENSNQKHKKNCVFFKFSYQKLQKKHTFSQVVGSRTEI